MIPEKRHTVGGVDVGPRTERDKLSFDAKQMPLMGEVGDPQARRDFDYYPTPAWMTRALLRRVGLFGGVIEPCAGRLAIANVLKGERDVEFIETNDLDPSAPTDTHLDAARPEYWKALRMRLANRPRCGVTNVPFDLADAIVPMAVGALPFFATILRLSWLEPTRARQIFLKVQPPRALIVLPRHDWRGNGSTDSVTSAWFIWGPVKPHGIEVVTKDERDELISLG